MEIEYNNSFIKISFEVLQAMQISGQYKDEVKFDTHRGVTSEARKREKNLHAYLN